jgi:serine/threonine protein phosphatase 1
LETLLPPPRTIAIGDIHGCIAALDALLAVVQPRACDTVVALGDYIDRGPDARAVIQRLLELQEQCHLVPLLGNHDDLMLNVRDGRDDLLVDWLLFGGDATLRSYGVSEAGEIPAAHADFLRSCPLWHETANHFFIHGNYLADLPLERQPRETLLWDSLKKRRPGPHCSGKTAVVGHASQRSGEVLDLGYLKCIDTRCFDQGYLTAMEIDGGEIWQADKSGRLRGRG